MNLRAMLKPPYKEQLVMDPFLRVVERPSPPPIPQLTPPIPQRSEMVRISRPLVDKIRKYGAEEFCGKAEDDPEKVEFWLENTIRVFNKLSCPSSDCLKCAIALLKDEAYQWWNTLIVVVPKDHMNWDLFRTKFRKKYVTEALARVQVVRFEAESSFLRVEVDGDLGPSRLTYKVEEEEVEGIMIQSFFSKRVTKIASKIAHFRDALDQLRVLTWLTVIFQSLKRQIVEDEEGSSEMETGYG
ncbi:hypothetical protein Goklo_029327, partial [Gossypium klotzschianum]|nr:hypothetical protein [Gossypium klotzschianum]